jgi:hypothetical protein
VRNQVKYDSILMVQEAKIGKGVQDLIYSRVLTVKIVESRTLDEDSQ